MEERSFFYRYCIVIPTSCPKIIQYVESLLKQNDFDVQSFEDKKKNYICISQNNEKRMLEQAQILKLKKQKNILSEEDEKNLKTYLDQRIIDLEKNQYFEAEKLNEFLPSKIYYDLYDIDLKNKENKQNDNKTKQDIIYELVSEMIDLEIPKGLIKTIIDKMLNEIFGKDTELSKETFKVFIQQISKAHYISKARV